MNVKTPQQQQNDRSNLPIGPMHNYKKKFKNFPRNFKKCLKSQNFREIFFDSNCSSVQSININLEPDGVNDSVFVNLSWDDWSSPDQTGESPPSDSGQNESSSKNSLAQDSSSGSVSSPPQKKTKMTNETAVTSEPVTQRPKNKGF